MVLVQWVNKHKTGLGWFVGFEQSVHMVIITEWLGYSVRYVYTGVVDGVPQGVKC